MESLPEQYQFIFEHVPVAIFRINTGNKIVLANPSAQSLSGYTFEGLQGMDIGDLIETENPSHPPLKFLSIENEKEESLVTDHELIHESGRKIPVQVSANKCPDGFLHLFIRDVSQEQRQSIAYREIEKRYETAFKSNPDSVAITDVAGTFIEVNQGFCRIFGWSMDEVLGRTAVELDIWVDIQERDQMFEIIRRDGFVFNFDARMRRKDGEVINVLASFTMMMLSDVPHNLSVIRDTTSRKKMEVELRKTMEKAEESDRLKTTFLTNLSHEIRTPMNGIMGISELLLGEEHYTSEHKELIKIIYDRGKDLLSLINNIIEVSKIETKQTRYSFSETSVTELLDAVRSSLKLNGDLKPAVQFHIESSEDIVIFSDADRLHQVLMHLLHNALKFTDKGEIRVSYEKTDEGGIEFVVQDTGIGISEENQSLIFERFRRVEGDDAIARGGAGLGLAICKSIIEDLGGTIDLKSKLGEGSEFRFTVIDQNRR